MRSVTGSGDTETEYDFALVPPGRDFSVGIVYYSKNGGPPTSDDEVLRPGGAFNKRAEALLDFVEQNYVAKNKTVSSVLSDTDGSVTVNWVQVKRFGPFSYRLGDFNELTYDEATGSWSVDSGGAL